MVRDDDPSFEVCICKTEMTIKGERMKRQGERKTNLELVSSSKDQKEKRQNVNALLE